MNRRRQRGQAFLEFALSLPLLILLALGAADLGRAFYFSLPTTGMASGGALVGAVSVTNDVGAAIRQQSSIVPNTATAWGNVYAGATYGSCDVYNAGSPTSQSCGDPYGCTTSGANNAFTATSRQGCFAVGMCTIDPAHSGQCSGAITWDSRPPSKASTTSPYTNAALVVKVVVVWKPMTPMIGSFFAGSGGVAYLTQTEVIPEQY